MENKLKLGDVVQVFAAMTFKIDKPDFVAIGTLTQIVDSEMEVLFEDGNIWRGAKTSVKLFKKID